MRKLLLTLASSTLLAAPFAAHAEFKTPGELVTAMQRNAARSFTAVIHGSNDGTYVSIWANGSTEGMTPNTLKLKTNATVDVVHGDFKLRAKGEMLLSDSAGYMKLHSVNGTFTNDFAAFNAVLNQKKWLKVPLDGVFGSAPDMSLTDLSTMDSEQANTMFTMQHTVSKGVNVYTLHLTPDSAIDLALAIRQVLGDDAPVSNDFFPWRELAEGMHFEMVVRTDANDNYLGNTITASTASMGGSFDFSTTETVLKGGLSVTVPKDVMTTDELMSMFGSNPASDLYFMGEPTMQDVEPSILPSDDSGTTLEWEEPATMWETDSPSYDASCMDPDLTPLKLLTLQRDGTCPVTKVPTRAAEYRVR